MRSRITTVATTCCICATIALSGCTTYYKVSDPGTGRAYYTTKIKEHRSSGGISFEDMGTGAQVTMQNSVVQKVSSDQAKKGAAAAPEEDKSE